MLKPLCTSKDDYVIYYDPDGSHASTHFADTPNLKELVIEVLESRDIASNELSFDLDMKRVIGTCDVVETDDSDEIIYAIRTKRFDQGLVPFVKTRKAQPSSYVSIALEATDDPAIYQLSSAWIGTFGDDPPFPGQPDAIPESVPYWSKRAFVWGGQPIEPGTEQTTRPW